MFEQLTFRLNQAILFEGRVKGLNQVVVLAGLGKEPKNTPFIYSFYRGCEVSLTGQNYADALWKSFFGRGQKLDSVHYRHSKVRKNYREWAVFFERFQALYGAFGRHDLELLPELALKSLQDIGLIIHAKDPAGHASSPLLVNSS
jgi:hypothetical protein